MELLSYFVSILVWGTLVVGIIFLLYLYLTRITNFWEVPGVEYKKSHLIFGDFYNVLVNKENFLYKLKSLYDTIRGPFGGFYLFTKPVLLIRDPDLMTRILITDIDQFTDRGLLTSNLLMFKGEQWRPLTDRLPTKMLKELKKREFDVLEKTCISLQNHVERVIKTSDVLDVRELMIRFATAVMTSIVFSNEIDSINTPDDMFCKMGRIIAIPTWFGQFRSMLAMAVPTFAKLFRTRTLDPNVEKFLYKFISRAIELRESGKAVERDYMQLLVQLRNAGKFNQDGKWNIESVDENNKHLTIDEVVMQTFLFYVHEFDAVSSAVSFALFELARNKNILMAMQIEIDEIVSKSTQVGPHVVFGNNRSSELCFRMTYANKVIDETLRKFPSVPVVVRSPLKPYKIPNTEIVLDTNQEIFIPVYAMHYDPKYFAQPNEFIPTRFDCSNINKRQSGTYFPFGDASPDWIRSDFTYLQIKMAIVAICSKFNLDLTPNCSRDITCRNLIYKDKLNLRVTARNEGFCRSM